MAEQPGHYDAPLYGIHQRPQRQDDLRAQLADLHVVAARLGMYDAADWLWKVGGLTEQASLFSGDDR